MDLPAFRASLAQPEPPAELTPTLRGLWHALRGEWGAAHEVVQAGDGTQAGQADCASVHAALHRQEGDRANARYWYRRAGRPEAAGTYAEEHLAIAATLL